MVRSTPNFWLYVATTLIVPNIVAEAINLDRIHLQVQTDRSPLSYTVNEPMRFTIDVDLAGQQIPAGFQIVWDRTGDDGESVSGSAALSELPVNFTTSLSRPGFVRLKVKLLDGQGETLKQQVGKRQRSIAFDGGAGVDWGEIMPALDPPAKFEEFWERQRKRLADTPMKVDMQKVESMRPGVDTYAISVDCPGPRPVTGFLTMPSGAEKGSLPARLMYFGYGVEKQYPHAGSDDHIVFAVNAHGYPLDRDESYYDKEFRREIGSRGKSYALDPVQNQDPEQSYFNGMALRVLRSIEFVKTLEQWDGETLVVGGRSQGGLQAVWGAALDHDVTLCETSITWCTNMAGNTQDGRLPGWHPEWVPALGYYDTVNHAPYIRCPVVIPRAGLGDYTCPPSGLAAFYSTLNVPKEITWVQGSTHSHVPANAETFQFQDR